MSISFYLVVAAATGYLLMEDMGDHFYKKSGQRDKKHLAMLNQATGEVLVKASAFSDWINAVPPVGVAAGALVSTSGGSTARFLFRDKSVLLLQENTMIEIAGNEDEYIVIFKKGHMVVQGESDHIRIDTKKATIRSRKGAEIHIKFDENSEAEVVMKKGHAEMMGIDKKVVPLSTKKLVQVDAKGKLKTIDLLVVLNKPIDGALMDDPRSSLQIPFKWTTLSPDIKGEIFQLSHSPTFPKKSVVEIPAHQGVTSEITRGKNFWRVGWKKGEKVYFTRPFQIFLFRWLYQFDPWHPSLEQTKSKDLLRAFQICAQSPRDFLF